MLVASTPFEQNRPKLVEATPEQTVAYIKNFADYVDGGGLYGILLGISREARSTLMTQLVSRGQVGSIKWADWDETELINAILNKYRGHMSVETANTLFSKLSMKPSVPKDTFDSDAISKYNTKVLDTVEEYSHVLDKTGFPEQVKLYTGNMLRRPLIAHQIAWPSVFAESNHLMERFIDHDIIEIQKQMAYPKQPQLQDHPDPKKSNSVRGGPKKENPPPPVPVPPPPPDIPVTAPIPPTQRSSCKNCFKSTDGHVIKTCTRMCFNKECRGNEPHLARKCVVWDRQLSANSAHINYPSAYMPTDQEIEEQIEQAFTIRYDD